MTLPDFYCKYPKMLVNIPNIFTNERWCISKTLGSKSPICSDGRLQTCIIPPWTHKFRSPKFLLIETIQISLPSYFLGEPPKLHLLNPKFHWKHGETPNFTAKLSIFLGRATKRRPCFCGRGLDAPEHSEERRKAEETLKARKRMGGEEISWNIHGKMVISWDLPSGKHTKWACIVDFPIKTGVFP